MKTKDGKDLKVGSFYYLENGQQVWLNSCATTPEGVDVFMVTPLYEGEAMSCDYSGGSHHEYSIGYEHEGEPTLVSTIFNEAPREKLCAKYRAEMDKIEHLSLSAGALSKQLNLTTATKLKLERKTIDVEKEYVVAARKAEGIKEELELLGEQLFDKRQKLSELEDSIGDMESEDVSSLVSKTELQRLNRRDFQLQCLEEGGVDNWDWYDESLNNYRERYPN